MTDGFIVVDEKYVITRINQTFNKYFGGFKTGQNFSKKLQINPMLQNINDKLIEAIDKAKNDKIMVSFESSIKHEELEKYFAIEVTPIILTGKHLETVILFRDITEQKKVINLIEQNQNQRIENERLFSLSQLIGGIAHNLKTPLLASSGGIEILTNHTKKIGEAIGEAGICEEESVYSDMIKEMEMWEDRIKEYISYMSEVITAVKGQTIPAHEDNNNYFELKNAVNRACVLMKHELKKNSCVIKCEYRIENSVKIKGNINYMIQVLNNLISNAIDSYKNQKVSTIEVLILKKLPDKIDIVVKDYGKGIREEIKNKLFKQMVTTKGKEGTGLGLYISKSIINSKFNGEIRLESVEGQGSSFIITIPTGGEESNE